MSGILYLWQGTADILSWKPARLHPASIAREMAIPRLKSDEYIGFHDMRSEDKEIFKPLSLVRVSIFPIQFETPWPQPQEGWTPVAFKTFSFFTGELNSIQSSTTKIF